MHHARSPLRCRYYRFGICQKEKEGYNMSIVTKTAARRHGAFSTPSLFALFEWKNG
jgi:hypothetical protein